MLAELAALALGRDDHRHRLDQVRRRRGGAGRSAPALHRRASDRGMETRGAQNARAELFEGATWYLTPLAETEPARLRDLHRLRGGARGNAGGDRRRRARPPARRHQPSPARAREPAGRAGRRGAHRRARPAHGDRRLVSRHDARRRSESAHLGRHLPRQPRRAREPCCASISARSARCSRRSRRATRAIWRAGSARPRAIGGARSRRSSTSVPRSSTACRCTFPIVPACSPASRRPSVPRASTSRTSSCITSRPSAAARSSCSSPAARPPSAAVELLDAQGYGALAAPVLADADMSAATGADRLEVAPAAALVGELAVPGDKSISHRALLLGAVADGATEISGFGANADTLATLAAVESLGARVERLDEAGDAPARARLRAARPAGRRTAPIDVHNAGTLMRLLPGPARRSERLVHARRRRVDPPAAGRPRGHAAAADGRRARRQRRAAAAAHRRRRRAAADRLRAAGGLRAGQVVHPPRGPLRRHRPDDRDRAGADARPHRAPAARRRCARRQGAAHGLGVARRATAARAASTCPATSPRPRRSSWRPRCWPSRACSCAACRRTRRAPDC